MQLNQYNDMMPVLGTEETLLMAQVDEIFINWATKNGAQQMTMPLLLPIQDLAKLNVYQNFPHQALVATIINIAEFNKKYNNNNNLTALPTYILAPATLALPAAACYAVYLHFSNQSLANTGTIITVLGRCCRHEEHYTSLCRTLSFHMREIIAFGTQEFVEQHLLNFSINIINFTKDLGLPVNKIPATDPFFQKYNSRALLQQLYPNKYEFIYNDLAIASINMHRNFFGERCKIMLANSTEYIYTSCVAFGLERWLSMLYQHYGSWQRAMNTLSKLANVYPHELS